MNTAFRLRSIAAVLALLSVPAMAQKTVTIGVVSATTGPLAAPGKFQLNGFALAVDTINKAGGADIAGTTYQVVTKVYDTHCSPAEGSSAMERLATVDKVPVVMGELCSPVAAAEEPVAADDQVPLILTVTTADSLTEQGNPYVFRVNASNGGMNSQLLDYILAQKFSSIGFLAFNSDTGRGGVQGLQASLPPAVKIAYVGYFNVGEVDFSSHVSNLRNSGAQAVVLLMDEEPGALAIRQIRDAGLQIKLIGTLAMGSNRFVDRLNAKYVAGMTQISAFPPGASIARIKTFNDAYKARFNEESHGFAAQSYDALMLAVVAMRAAGTVSDTEAIRTALTHVKYEGVIGPIQFDAHGQASPPVYLTQWCDDGTRKIIAPVELASGCGGG